MPMFKKSGGKIFAVQFNKAEERALDQEIKKQIVENDRAFDMDKESSILWMLHIHPVDASHPIWLWPKAPEAGVEAVLCRNLEATGTLPDGTSR